MHAPDRPIFKIPFDSENLNSLSIGNTVQIVYL